MNNACGICIANAVRQGVNWTDTVNTDDIVGSHYMGGQIHEAVTLLGGTAVCWYHADDAAKAVGL